MKQPTNTYDGLIKIYSLSHLSEYYTAIYEMSFKSKKNMAYAIDKIKKLKLKFKENKSTLSIAVGHTEYPQFGRLGYMESYFRNQLKPKRLQVKVKGPYSSVMHRNYQ